MSLIITGTILEPPHAEWLGADPRARGRGASGDDVGVRRDRQPSRFDVDDVAQGPPPWSVLVRRGLTKRCPRCGGRPIFDTWFRMKPRCPACGYKFEREPGFFIGVYFINFVIVEAFLFLLLVGVIAWKSSRPDAGIVIPLVLAVVHGLTIPLLVYPYARSIWSAIDLVMTPLDVKEIVEAIDAGAPDDPGEPPDPDGPDDPHPDGPEPPRPTS